MSKRGLQSSPVGIVHQSARFVAAAAAAFFAAPSAGAMEVNIPKTAPRVSIQIPDGWAASYTAIGLELESPEKSSLIIAQVVAHDEQAVAAWAYLARGRLIEMGAVFDPSAPTRIVKMKHKAAEGLTPDPSGKSFSFSGPPHLNRVPEAPAQGPKSAAMTPFQVVRTIGARLGGKPVDTEISYYALSKGQLLAVEQQSGATDGRAVSIINSLKMLP